MKKSIKAKKNISTIVSKKGKGAVTTSTSRKRRLSLNSEQEENLIKKEAKLATSPEVFSIFTPKTKIEWSQHESILIGLHQISKDGRIEDNRNIAGLDLDCTLISSKGNRKVSKDKYDWVWWSKEVPTKLKKIYEEGIVIISNQNGLDVSNKNSEKKRTDFINKIGNIANSLNVPFEIYAATSKDKYRKPMIGIWKYLVENRINGVVDMEKSFYVGDAAGRVNEWADTDRKFSENAGLKFYTPDEFFKNSEIEPFSYDFDPKKISKNDKKSEIIVFVGYPASGKTTFANKCDGLQCIHDFNLIHSENIFTQDTLKTKAKCVKTCEEALKKSKPVVIDNTNPDVENRKMYIDLAKKYDVPIRCFWFQASEALSKHNNMYRAFGTTGQKRPLLPEVTFHYYRSRFIEPKIEEGFQEINDLQ
ncbi:8954_t:CDS:10 [Diversispora eburnea]|uniref:8954_t:CDS:1 n=1 Tax=Diversispora eburnea TaxID=1213867 RepID=A0A9N8WM39_9GLOM|nr:8954_t:CDS:10 [Diversispora eburnea]